MSLTDHILVVAHLQPQVVTAAPTAAWEDVLRRLGAPESVVAAISETDRSQPVGQAGPAKTTSAALAFQPSGVVHEVPWPCSCGAELHAHHDFAAAAWARHAAAAEGLEEGRLIRHVIMAINGERPTVHCACSTSFQSSTDWPEEALAMWAAHVRDEVTA